MTVPLNDTNRASARLIRSGIALTILLAAGVAWSEILITHASEIRKELANQAAVGNLPPIPVNDPYPKIFFQKGVSLSAEFPDPYGSAADASRAASGRRQCCGADSLRRHAARFTGDSRLRAAQSGK